MREGYILLARAEGSQLQGRLRQRVSHLIGQCPPRSDPGSLPFAGRAWNIQGVELEDDCEVGGRFYDLITSLVTFRGGSVPTMERPASLAASEPVRWTTRNLAGDGRLFFPRRKSCKPRSTSSDQLIDHRAITNAH